MRNYQYFLSIDISKESFDFCLLNSISNNPLENQKLKMNKQGFEQKEDFSETITKVKSQIKNLLNKLFPELEHITNPFSKTIINLLSEAPSPQKIVQKGVRFY